jgi:hypothetical protein
MIPHHVYYLLTAMGCLWLCIMLHTIWSSRGAVSPQPLAEPVPPQCKRKRSNEPKAFEGLTVSNWEGQSPRLYRASGF